MRRDLRGLFEGSGSEVAVPLLKLVAVHKIQFYCRFPNSHAVDVANSGVFSTASAFQ